MADEKYSIDDILKEVDSSRMTGRSKKSSFNGSVTDILGEGDEIDKLIKSGKQQKKSDLSVTEVIDSIKGGKQSTPVKSARQLTEKETEARIASEVAKAADNRRSFIPDDDDDVIEYAAKQRTDDEVRTRIAKDISKAADIKRYEELTGFDEDDREYDDWDDEEVTEYAPESPDRDNSDDIELHDASSFVPSETMEIRRQKKLTEFQNAMLKYDSEAETPDDMVDSLNPMESREKAAEQLRGDEDTDTLAVSGNDLKTLGKEEHIKEYTPSASRKRDRSEEEPERPRTPFTGELHVGENMIDALNMKINEQSSVLSDASGLIIAPPPNTGEEVEVFHEDEDQDEGELDKIKQANELVQKKKRRIADFILEKHDGDFTGETDKAEENNEPREELESEEEEEQIDLNDEEVIKDRLERASKGLLGRLIILAVLFAAAIFIGAVNIFRINIGRIGNIISYRSSPENYIYAHLAIGILSFAACSSVVSNGFARLFRLRPDGDTLCALAHMGAIVATIPYLASGEYIQRGLSQIYIGISLAAMIFNTISKLLTVKTAQKNFDFIFGRDSKYFIERCEGNGAEQLAKGSVEGMPAIASIRKTEMLCDFIVSTYCEDSSDRVSRKIAPIAIAAAIAGGIIGYFTCSATIVRNHPSWAATVASAILAVAAPFSSSMTVTLPMYLASRKAKERGAAILGFAAAEEMSETNAILTNAKMLFPPETVKIVNICGYDTPKTRGEGKINIDEAIIFAASLAVASDSVMSDSLFHILNYKRELLKPVSGCVYENGLGVMGWIDRRRVLLGTRAHMKAHEITVPNTKKEAAANKNNDEVIYLAVGGEVCLLFFVKLLPDPVIRRSVRELAFRDIAIVVKTVDGMMTAPVIARVFGIDPEGVRVLPLEQHETFDEHTKFVSSGSAAISGDGTFASLSNAITASRAIRDRATIGNIMQIVGVVLGMLIAIIFTLVSNEEQVMKFNIFNIFYLLLYNAVCGVLTLGVQFFRRT